MKTTTMTRADGLSEVPIAKQSKGMVVDTVLMDYKAKTMTVSSHAGHAAVDTRKLQRMRPEFRAKETVEASHGLSKTCPGASNIASIIQKITQR